MLKLTIERPNTLGVTHSAEYENYAQAEAFIELRVERLCDKGWQASEFADSTSERGIIELTHDDVADSIVIQWETI